MRINIVKPEFGISGLDTHVVSIMQILGAKLFTGEGTHLQFVDEIVMPNLLSGEIKSKELNLLTDCNVLYFPNVHKPRYSKLLKRIVEFNTDLRIVNRCGSFVSSRVEASNMSNFFRVVVPSNILKTNLVNYGVSSKKIVLLRNAVISSVSKVSMEKVRQFKEKYGLKRKFSLLYPGRYASMSEPGEIELYKGLGFILDVMRDLDQKTQLLIAGSDLNDHTQSEVIRKKIMDIAGTMRIRSKIIFLNKRDCMLSNFGVSIAASDIVVHPNIAPEPFGTAVIESMYLKKPVIISSLTGAIEVMKAPLFIGRSVFTNINDSVIVSPGDRRELVSAINFLRENKDVRKTMGINASRSVSQFSEKKMGKTFKKVFTSMADDVY